MDQMTEKELLWRVYYGYGALHREHYILFNTFILVNFLAIFRIGCPRSLLKNHLNVYLSRYNLLECANEFSDTLSELICFIGFMRNERHLHTIVDIGLLRAMIKLGSKYEYELLYIEALSQIYHNGDYMELSILPSLCGYSVDEIIDCPFLSEPIFITLIAKNGERMKVLIKALRSHQYFKDIFEIFDDNFTEIQLDLCPNGDALESFLQYINKEHIAVRPSRVYKKSLLFDLLRMGDCYMIDDLLELLLQYFRRTISQSTAELIFNNIPVHLRYFYPLANELHEFICKNYIHDIFNSDKFLQLDIHSFHKLLTFQHLISFPKLIKYWMEFDLDRRRAEMAVINSSHPSGLYEKLTDIKQFHDILMTIKELNFRWPLFEEIAIKHLFQNEDEFKHFSATYPDNMQEILSMDFVIESTLNKKQVSSLADESVQFDYADRRLNENSFALVYYDQSSLLMQIYRIGGICLEKRLSLSSSINLEAKPTFLWKDSKLFISQSERDLLITDMKANNTVLTTLDNIICDECNSVNEEDEEEEYDSDPSLASWEFVLFQDDIFAISRDTRRLAKYSECCWLHMTINNNIFPLNGEIIVIGEYIFFNPNDDWVTYIKASSGAKYEMGYLELSINKAIIGGCKDNGKIYIFHKLSVTILREEGDFLVLQEERPPPLPSYKERWFDYARPVPGGMALISISTETDPMIFCKFNVQDWSSSDFQATGTFPYPYIHMRFAVL